MKDTATVDNHDIDKEGAYIRDLTGGVAPPLKRVTGVSYGEG